MDYDKLADAITEKTKVVIPVDLAGIVCDYDRIFAAVESRKQLFRPTNELQKAFGRVIVLADAAHAFGAKRAGRVCGEIADFTSFSFHAVKNLTTAEGGALTWRNIPGIDNEWLYKQFQLLSLHGQSKDALAKTQLGAWEYDIVSPAYKCNMTDIMAGIGLVQLKRYPELLKRRREIDVYKRQALNPIWSTYAYEHKGMYGFLLKNVPQPITVVNNIDGQLYDADYVQMCIRDSCFSYRSPFAPTLFS